MVCITDVVRIAVNCRHAYVRQYWYHGPGDIAGSPPAAGNKRWRGIWRIGHLSQRNGYPRQAGILFQLSICYFNRRPVDCVRYPAYTAEMALVGSAITCLGMAYPFCDWRHFIGG